LRACSAAGVPSQVDTVSVVGDVQDRVISDLAPSGVLRAAINLGNPVLARPARYLLMRAAIKKISFKPTSRRSSHPRPARYMPARRQTRDRADASCGASAQVAQVFGTHKFRG
jgi:hypothetical protein